MTSRFLACVTMKEGLGENHQEGPFIIFLSKVSLCYPYF